MNVILEWETRAADANVTPRCQGIVHTCRGSLGPVRAHSSFVVTGVPRPGEVEAAVKDIESRLTAHLLKNSS